MHCNVKTMCRVMSYSFILCSFSIRRKFVVFGELVQGDEVLKKIEEAGDEEGRPAVTVKIINCGEFGEGKPVNMLLSCWRIVILFLRVICPYKTSVSDLILCADKKKGNKSKMLKDVSLDGNNHDTRKKGNRKKSSKDRRKKRRKYYTSDSESSSDSEMDSSESDSDSDSSLSSSSDISSSSEDRRRKRKKSSKRDKHRRGRRREKRRDRKRKRRDKKPKRKSRR